ncbi:unnamed protein product [Microthlaspi erraticum]|uniref:Uncharacterized protein n=1 Tax=Microthlaspi erraticum TaxID=1685480 RepID=A0A6D2IQ92_9BRAS|nr:unnamed protein product [Microthlaspi erraticum]
MDFIKTSSLRALIELTFQRNWNGLIWMSRKGVTTKRVKTVQTALSRISAQPRSPAGRGTNVHARPESSSVRLKSRPKSKTVRPRTITTRETLPAVGHATTVHATAAHDHAREPGSKASRPRNCLAYHGMNAPSEPGNSRVRPRDFIGQISSVRPQRPTTHPSGHDRSDSAMTRSSGRSSRPTVPTPRSTRSPF